MSINTKDLIDEVRKVAEAQPDYVYFDEAALNSVFGCSYNADGLGNRDGQPCLIGQALRNLGVTVSEEDEDSNIKHLLDECLIDVVVSDLNHTHWLDRAQVAQDCGDTWGKAVEVADAWMSL